MFIEWFISRYLQRWNQNWLHPSVQEDPFWKTLQAYTELPERDAKKDFLMPNKEVGNRLKVESQVSVYLCNYICS